MNTKFPRIITNGRLHRIEVAPEKYIMIYDQSGTFVWETRFLWRAKRKLRRAIKEYQPQHWKRVFATTQKERTGEK